MKYHSLIAMGVAISVASASAEELVQAENLKKSSSHLAAQLVVEKLRDDVATNNTAVADLTRIMLADPQRYRAAAESRILLKNEFAASVKETFRRRVDALLDRMAKPKTRQEYFGEEFLAKAENPGDAFVNRVTSESYERAFGEARKKACEEQSKRLSSAIRPTEEEVDATDRNRLVHSIAGKLIAAKKNAIFDENVGYVLNTIAGPVVDEALKQRNLQREAYMTMSANSYTPSFLETNLLRNIKGEVARIQRERKAEGQHGYGLFPSVTNAGFVAKAAKKRAVKNLTDALEAVSTNTFDCKWAEKEILSNIDKHRSRGDSENQFRTLNGQRMEDLALREIRRNVPNNEKKAFEQYFMETGSRDSNYTNLRWKRASQEFWPLVVKVRNNCASNQFAQFYAKLKKGTWYPEADVVDTICLSPDVQAETWRWRKYKDFSEFSNIENKQPIIGETSDMVNNAMRNAIYAGVAARSGQHNVVRSLYNSIRQHYESQGSAPSVETVIADYEKRVSERWNQEIAKCLGKNEAAIPKYEKLFDSTHELIEIRAKAIVSMSGSSNTANGDGSDDGDVVPCSATVSFDIKDNKVIEAAIRVNGETIKTLTANMEKQAFRRELRNFAHNVAESVLIQIRKAAKQNRLNVRLNLVVRDNTIYYGAVIDVYDNIRAGVEQLGPNINSFRTYGAPRN